MKRKGFRDVLTAGTSNIGNRTTFLWCEVTSSKVKNLTVVLEVIAEGEFLLHGFHLGKTGDLSDISILDSVPFVLEILERKMLTEFEFESSGNKYKQLRFVVDGIYLYSCIIASRISESTTRKEKLFPSTQDALFNNAERAVGVLLSKCAFSQNPLLYENKTAPSSL